MTQRVYTPEQSKLDLLFVIDRSPAMAGKLAMLEEGLPRLIEALDRTSWSYDLHLGVAAADLEDGGSLSTEPGVEGCAPPAGSFIRWRKRIQGAPETNFTGTLADTFACITSLGAQGPGPAQPLEALRAVLTRDGDHAAFVRDDAYLGVVIIVNQDDASPGQIAAYVNEVTARKGHPVLIVGSVVAPTGSDRLLEWVAALGVNGRFIAIEGGDLRGALDAFTQELARFLGTTCLAHDLDPSDRSPEPGLQVGCVATEVSDGVERAPLPRCAVAADGTPARDTLPCWWALPSEACSDFASGLEIRIERDDFPPRGTAVVLRCEAQCAAAEPRLN